MKKILYLITMSVALSSCLVEEVGSPQRTVIAHQYYLPVENSVRSGMFVVDLSEKIDMWLSATTQSERDRIEDLYLFCYKVRVNGGVVSLKNIGGVDFMSISTRGFGFNSDGAHWTYATIADTLDIKRLASQQWHLTDVACDNPGNKYDLKFTKTASGNQYKVSGSGVGVLMGDNGIGVTYTIDNNLIIQYHKTPNLCIDIFTVELIKGEISYISSQMSEKATVKFMDIDNYSITYKGFTENWQKHIW